MLPAVKQVRLALALSDFSASWRGSRGLLSNNVSVGMTTICAFNEPRRLEIRDPTSYALVLLRNEILEQALDDSRLPRVELQARYHVQDETIRHLIEVLLHEKRQGFQNGALFLDSVSELPHPSLLRSCASDRELRGRDGAFYAPSVHRIDGGASGRRASTG